MMSSDRPAFVVDLLARPLPDLGVQANDTSNKVYCTAWRSQIENGMYHPLIQATLHLMNDDLFSAHFLLRKMQSDAIGKWLHGILHKREGDYANVKAWYRDTPHDLLEMHFGHGQSAQVDACQGVDRVALLSGRDAAHCIETSEKVKVISYSLAELRTLHPDLEVEKRAQWAELVTLLEHLERKHGWTKLSDASQVYAEGTTNRQPEPKSMILGEGWRRF